VGAATGKLDLNATSAKWCCQWLERRSHTSFLDTDLTRNTRATHFTPQYWLLCHMGLYQFEFEFELVGSKKGLGVVEIEAEG